MSTNDPDRMLKVFKAFSDAVDEFKPTNTEVIATLAFVYRDLEKAATKQCSDTGKRELAIDFARAVEFMRRTE